MPHKCTRSRQTFLLLGLFWLFHAQLASAQLTEATLKGIVTDASGGAIGAAPVVANNESTGTVRSTVTDAGGVYLLPGMAPGSYSVSVSMQGFKSFEQKGLVLRVGRSTELNIRMDVGDLQTRVEVSTSAGTIPISTEGRLSDTFEQSTVTDLPIPQRDVFFLPSLSAGATNIPGANYAYKLILSPAVAVNGNRFRGNNYVLDGSMDTDTINAGEPAIVPNLESIEEVQVQTGNFSSEYGRGNGSVVNIRTKSGTNEFHGKVWEYHQDAALNAKNFFATTKPPLVLNQFGANAGGPIIKNKTFVFGSYEGTRHVVGQALPFQVETPEFREYVLKTAPSSVAASLLRDFPAPAPAPGTAGKKYQGEVDITTPQGVVIPGTGTTQYILGDYLRSDQYLTRVDHAFNNGKDTLTGRWIGQHVRTDGGAFSSTRRPAPGQAMRGFRDPASLFFGNFNVGETHVFGRVVNDVRFSFIENNSNFTRPYLEYPVINISGVTASFGDPTPFLLRLRTYEARDTLSFVRGKHLLRAGLEVRKLFMGLNLGAANAGTYSFNNLLDFAADKPFQQARFVDPETGQPVRADRIYTFNESGVFLQDDWKATSRLTINLGIRNDYFGNPSERYGRLSSGTWGPGSSFNERLANASVGVVPRYFDPKKLNVSPRIGFAYDPFGDGKSSIRAGYSISYQPFHGRSILGATTNNPPFNIQAILQPNVGIGTDILYGIPVPYNPQFKTELNSQGGVVSTPGKAPIRIAPGFVDPNLQTQYSESWFLNVEREVVRNWIVELGYVGTNGIALERRDDINRIAGDLLDGRLDRINPNFGGMTFITTGIRSSYNAMTAEVRHRVSNGLMLQGNYRWSKWLDEASDTDSSSFSDNAAPAGDGGAQNITCLQCERGRSEFDIPHRFTASLVWTPRVATGQRWVDKIANDWQISTIIAAQSGRPFNAFCAASFQAGCDYNADGGGGIGNGAYYDRPNAPAPGAVKSSFSQQDFLNGLFDPNIFPRPIPGTDGNLGRDVYRGPHQVNTNLALARSFRVGEGKELQFRGEAFNALNKVNLFLPNMDLALALKPDKTYSTTSSFSKSTRAFDPRILQLSLRFSF